MISDAVTLERISRILGYKIIKGDFATSSPNLPQRIAVLGEANEANQLDLVPDVGQQITTAQQAGELYGYGSPIYLMARILLPQQSSGVGGIPVIVYPQAKASGASSKIIEITPVGTATANGTHYLVVAGRDGLDGEFYAINIEEGDTVAQITGKITDALNNVLGCPVIATDDDYVTTCETKWKGLTADGVSITVDIGENDLGLTYTVNNVQAGAGTPDIAAALAAFGADWVTLVVNSYGTHSTTMSALESFNGIPDPTSPTGRYQGIVMKPFVALTGSISDDPSAITDARPTQVTIAICPAPNSAGLAMEAAANMCVLQAVNAQNTPELDVIGLGYPDMPIASNLGAMAVYNTRDAIVKKGCSTVTLEAGQYIIQDFVTTYHKAGELPPQFRYVRNLFIDFNIRYAYYLLEQINVVDHVISTDDTIVSVAKVIKPKQWKQILFTLADDLGKRGLIVVPKFMKDSIVVGIGTTNPDRFETSFSYKRSGVARVISTTAKAGFNFGTL